MIASFSGAFTALSTESIHGFTWASLSSIFLIISRCSTLTVFSGSTRKTVEGFAIAECRAKASSTAVRPNSRYCSNWSLEMNWDAPTVSKLPAPPSAGRDSTFRLTPVRDFIVFWYSLRLRRRIVICPPESESFLRAKTMVLARSSRKSALATFSGCRLFSGGISPEFITSKTFCQSSAC